MTIDEEKAKFILAQVQLTLKSKIESSDSLVSKGYELLKFNITFLTIETAALANSINLHLTTYIASLTILMVFNIIACFFLKNVISPRSFIPLGNEPQNLIDDTDYTALPLSEMITEEAKNYSERIKETTSFQTQASEMIKCCIWTMFAAPIISFLVYLYLVFGGCHGLAAWV